MKIKKLLSVLLVLCMVLAWVPVKANAAEIASGTCGGNLTWVLTDDGTLTISGEGQMDDATWGDYSDSITKVIIEDGVTNICDFAFEDCSNMTSVTIPDSVTQIGWYAFSSCTSLTDIYIPASVTELGYRPFESCTVLTAFSVDENNPNFCNDTQGVLYTKDMTTLLKAPTMLAGEYVVPDTVTIIDSYAFWGCKLLTAMTVGSNVTIIGDAAFADCTGLVTMNIDADLDGYKQVADCTSLTDLNLGNNVTSLGAYNFVECVSLETVTIPASVIDYGVTTFRGCTGLKTVYFEGDGEEQIFDVFPDLTLTAYYPARNETWTEEVRASYGGDITWIPYYLTVEGDNSQWTEGSTDDLTVRVDADIAKFVEVQINGEVVDPVNYTVTEGSTIVALKPEYLETLPVGEYTMTIVFTDGTATATFVIVESTVVLGDVNENGEIDIFDANLIAAYYNEVMDLTEAQLAAADVNGDGEVNIFDANLVAAYYNEVIDAFPVE